MAIERSNHCLGRAVKMARELLILADQGDAGRDDVGCGVLWGTVRDCAYRIKALAEAEIDHHNKVNTWASADTVNPAPGTLGL